MRQKKNRKKKKNRKIRILTGVVLGVGLAGALFFNVFKIRNIQVAGNTRYTKDEIKEMVADDKWMKNTVLLTTFHSKVDMSDIPFMNSVEFTFVSYDTICIQVNEKKVVGYVEYEGQKVYFDKNGIVLECVDEEQETPGYKRNIGKGRLKVCRCHTCTFNRIRRERTVGRTAFGCCAIG